MEIEKDEDDDKYACLKLENQLCFPIYACAREIVKKYREFLKPLDLTYTQYITMMVLWDKRKTNICNLGKMLYLDSGTLTPLIKKLEQKGFVTRRRDDNDNRNLIVEITQKGLDLRELAVDVPKKVGNKVCPDLDFDDAKELYRMLYEMLDFMNEEKK